AADRRLDFRGVGWHARDRGRRRRRPDRLPAQLCPRDRVRRRDPRRRLRHGPMTTALIALPLVAALVVWVLPLPGRAAGALALLAALAEVVLYAVAFAQFDFSEGLQLRDQHSWFSDLGVSYDVGFYGFSLFLAGLTIVVCTVAIAYALWAGGDRSRGYHGLLLFLTGSIVGVFAAQDLLVFYVFFEAMLIPIYVLIGVWGGPRRVRATATFVIYTMAGSLLMLASIIA